MNRPLQPAESPNEAAGWVSDRDRTITRLIRLATALLLVMACVTLVLWGFGFAASVLIGGAFAIINFRWMKLGVDRMLGSGQSPATSSVMVKFLLRIVLILVGLFVMIHFSFFSLYGAVLGLSIFVLAGTIEAVVLLVQNLR
ncbi:MAG: ATP synthase subunit I [Acidobacteriota bacterium]|nr:MAG: ATP synthase subunit I [Acidobacteriota bacterium]